MRAFEAEIELSDVPDVLRVTGSVTSAAGFEIGRKEGPWRSPRNYKNTGNKAKKWLKTKDITFSSAENDACFARQSAQIT